MDDFKRLNQEFNRTVIVNIHSIELARNYATHIIGMRAGQIVFDGTPEEATDAKLNEIYGREIFNRPIDRHLREEEPNLQDESQQAIPTTSSLE